MKNHSIFLLVLVSLFLTACVEDFGDYWAQGKTDPVFEGRWKAVRASEYVNEIWVDDKNVENEEYDAKIAGDYIQVSKADSGGQNNESMRFKTLTLSGKNFFMIQNDEGEGVDLLLYELSQDSNTLKLYPLHKKQLSKAVQEGHIKGRVDNGMPVVAKMDDSLVSFIDQLPKGDESWPKFVEYERVKR